MATTESGVNRLQEKKDKVMQKKAKLSSTSILILLIIGAMAAVGIFIWRSGDPDTKQVKPPKQVPRVAVSGPVDYTEARVDMKRVDYKTAGDNVILSLADIEKNKFVRFDFHSKKLSVRQRNFAGKPVLPVMALIVPSGKLMVGVSYCEPCRSTTFHTERDISLTCNVCGTKWDLESLLAWSGACMPFPPDEVKVAVKDGKVLIPKGYLESWQPRKEM